MKLSIISPVFNEAGNLRELFGSLIKNLTPLGYEWELVFVDDGSTDKSLSIMREFLEQQKHAVQIIEFRKNFGQTAAIAAGIEYAKGDIIILLDADLQNDPADIPLLLNKMDEGYDVVSGWRKDRKDNFIFRTIPSRIANGLISSVTGLKLHDYGCTLKAYRREFLGMFRLYGEMHRFIPVYAEASGAKVAEVIVHHHQRKNGKSNYGLDRTIKVILDLFTVKFLMSYSAKPMRLFGGVGLGLMVLSAAALLFLAIRKIILTTSVLESPLFVTSVLMFILGFISILLGMIAELLIRTYYETQGKSTYAIRAVTKSSLEK
jgi:glycosyltransferase involved in cell wall biosynthesis